MVKKLILLIILINLINAKKFILTPLSDVIYEKCTGSQGKFLDTYFDLSGLKFNRLDDDIIEANGVLKYIGNITKDDPIQGEMKIYQKVLSGWVEIMGIYREDVCLVMFNKNEMWYPTTSKIPEKNKICPPKFGDVIKIDKILLEYRFDGGSMNNPPGTYKAVVNIRNAKDHICFVLMSSLNLE